MIPLLAALPMPILPPPSAELAIPSDSAALFAAEFPPEEERVEEDAPESEPPGLPLPLLCQMPEVAGAVPLELPEATDEADISAAPATAFAMVPDRVSAAIADQPSSGVVATTDAPSTVEVAKQEPARHVPQPADALDGPQAVRLHSADQSPDGVGVVVHVMAEHADVPARVSGAQSVFEMRAQPADEPSTQDAVEPQDESHPTEVQPDRTPDQAMPADSRLDSPMRDGQEIGALPLPASGTGTSARPVIGQVQAAVMALARAPTDGNAPDAAQRITTPERGVELRLDPEELGQVSISLRSEGDALMVRVVAERPETLDLLRRNADQLLQDLRSAGFRDAQMAFGSSEESARGGQQPATDPGLLLAEEEIPSQPPPGTGFVGAGPISRDGALNIRL